MYLSEAAFVAVAFICVVMATMSWGRGTQLRRDAVATVGGISASLAVIMPFELAPFFFGARGEWMLVSIALNLVYPVAAIVFILAFRKSMSVDLSGPGQSPISKL
jgi:thiosulfate dehydrogenase [quinone] large subunit